MKMNSRKMFGLELFLIGTLFLNHYIVFHGLMPSPLYWIFMLLENYSPISVLMTALIAVMLFQSFFSFKKESLSPIARGGITLALSCCYILVSTLNQYIDAPQYLDISILTSVPFMIGIVLICLEIRTQMQNR